MDLKVAPINTVLYKKGFFKNTCKHSINNENKHFETLSFQTCVGYFFLLDLKSSVDTAVYFHFHASFYFNFLINLS